MKSQPKSEDSDKEDKPYLQFKYCKVKCFACNSCGYFWGPGHKDQAGQPVKWTL